MLDKEYINKKNIIAVTIILLSIFLPSFLSASKSIFTSYMYNKARELYIISQLNNGNSIIYVKSPITIDDSHNGMYKGKDYFDDPNLINFVTHNKPKATWYGAESIIGIPPDNQSSLTESIKKYFLTNKQERNNLYEIIYENW